jgi:hypothetical protein
MDPIQRLKEGLPENEELARHLLGLKTPDEFRALHPRVKFEDEQGPAEQSEDPESESESASAQSETLRDAPPTPFQSTDDEDDMSDVIFDGRDGERVGEFLRIAEATFKLHDKYTDNDERKAAYVISKIRHPATTWLEQAIEADGEVETDYTTLKDAMLARYGPSVDELKLRSQDLIRKIRQKGTLQAYDTYFESLWSRSELSEESEKARLFRNGLYPAIKRYVMERPDYTDARSKAWILDKAEQHQRAREASVTTPRRSRFSTPVPVTPGSSSRGSDKCFKCGKFGHWAVNCSERRSYDAYRPAGTPSSRRRSRSRSRAPSAPGDEW